MIGITARKPTQPLTGIGDLHHKDLLLTIDQRRTGTVCLRLRQEIMGIKAVALEGNEQQPGVMLRVSVTTAGTVIFTLQPATCPLCYLGKSHHCTPRFAVSGQRITGQQAIIGRMSHAVNFLIILMALAGHQNHIPCRGC